MANLGSVTVSKYWASSNGTVIERKPSQIRKAMAFALEEEDEP